MELVLVINIINIKLNKTTIVYISKKNNLIYFIVLYMF